MLISTALFNGEADAEASVVPLVVVGEPLIVVASVVLSRAPDAALEEVRVIRRRVDDARRIEDAVDDQLPDVRRVKRVTCDGCCSRSGLSTRLRGL
jgi:hypothetical protein